MKKVYFYSEKIAKERRNTRLELIEEWPCEGFIHGKRYNETSSYEDDEEPKGIFEDSEIVFVKEDLPVDEFLLMRTGIRSAKGNFEGVTTKRII